MSFNTNDKKVENKKIIYIKKHKVDKRLFRIKHDNDEVVVTEDHSIVVLRNDSYISISAKNINTNDKLIKNDNNVYSNFSIEDLGVQESWVYDIEVEDNHNFFGNNILLHNSNYIWLEHIYNKTKKEDESFYDWIMHFESSVLNPFIDRCMNYYSKIFNTSNLLYFKREKIILKQFVQAKKKYATLVIANEKDVYDHPKLKVTGIEINKSDLCAYSRKKLRGLLDIMFKGDKPNREEMLEFIRSCNKEFKKQTIEDISIPKGVKDYQKYKVDLTKDYSCFKPCTPIHNRSSIVYNHVIRSNKLPYIEVNNGTKIKYVFVDSNNKYKTNVIAFVGNYPKEFNKMFKIDYQEQFEKQFLGIAQRMFDVLDFGVITMNDSKIMFE